MSISYIILLLAGVVGLVGFFAWKFPNATGTVAEIGGDIADIASSIGGDGGDGGGGE